MDIKTMLLDAEFVFWSLLVIAIDVAIVYYAIKKLPALWNKIKKDGITLDEIEDLVEEVMEIKDDIEEVVDKITELPSLSKMNKMKKEELIQLAKSHSVSHEGTKDNIIERLKELIK